MKRNLTLNQIWSQGVDIEEDKEKPDFEPDLVTRIIYGSQNM
jgi:hypothetical protein